MLNLIVLVILGVILLFYFTELIERLIIVLILVIIIWVYYINYVENFIDTRPEHNLRCSAAIRDFLN